jgi:hypothetical protein
LLIASWPCANSTVRNVLSMEDSDNASDDSAIVVPLSRYERSFVRL